MADKPTVDAFPFDPDQVLNAAANAPEAGFSKLNFGKLVTTALVLTWVTDGGVRKPVRRPLMPGQALAQGETMELRFIVQISEFNPSLTFEYERSIGVRKSRKSGDKLTDPTDWSEIVEPSLVKVFGKSWPRELLKQPYVCCEDVPNVLGKTSNTSGKIFGVPRFLRRFKDVAECAAARAEVFPEATVSNNGGFPLELLADIRSVVEANGVDTAMQLLASKPYGDYEPEALLEAAGVKIK